MLTAAGVAVGVGAGFGASHVVKRLFRGGSRKRRALKGVVVVCIDAFRGDMIGFEIGGMQVTPYLNKLAAEGLVFSNAYSSSDWTLPGVASIFTGEPALVHGAVGRAYTLPEMPTVASILGEHGYGAYGAVNNSWIGSTKEPAGTGFRQGFDAYSYFDKFDFRSNDIREGGRPFQQATYVDDDAIRRFVLEAIDGRNTELPVDTARPMFLYVHSMATHHPYPPVAANEFTGRFLSVILSRKMTPAEAWKAEWGLLAELKYGPRKMDCPAAGDPASIAPEETAILQAAYFEAAAAADRHVELLFEELRERGGDELTFVVTADHGESLGELPGKWRDGEWEHGSSALGQSVTHVPLIFSGPRFAKRTVTSRVPAYCMAATLFDALGIERPGSTLSYSLLDVADGADMPLQFAARRGAAAYIAPDGKKIVRKKDGGGNAFYDLASDPYSETTPGEPAQAELLAALAKAEGAAMNLCGSLGISPQYTQDPVALAMAGLTPEEIEKALGDADKMSAEELDTELEQLKTLGYAN
jgi:arylsulfatase A-like enzyme